MNSRVRVLVVDDSALMRKLIPQVLRRDPAIEVIGTAMDGAFALEKIAELKPHVITLDLEMPRMSGVETLREIMLRYHLPVIVVSAHTTQGASATFKALAMGAIDFVAKPADSGTHIDQVGAELISKIKIAAQSGAPTRLQLSDQGAPRRKQPGRAPQPATRIIAIGVSTGGPNALQYLFSQLPPEFPAATVVVQHMPAGFTETFAKRLNECSALEVKEARSGDLLIAGRVLICPGNRHMRVRRMPLGQVVVLSDEDSVSGHRPSVDVLFRSLAEEFGTRAIAVIMTGMGEDGAAGMGAVKAAGGLTIAQSAESCVVSGMPRAAINRGHAMRVVPLQALAHTLQAHCASDRTRVVAAIGAEG